MLTKLAFLAAFLGGAAFALALTVGAGPAMADPVPPEEADVPESPPMDTSPETFTWNPLDFTETIPLEWGTVFSINRVEKGGESYTFWFLASDGTLRGVTTQKFTGPNRGSFFPEVYVIRRK